MTSEKFLSHTGKSTFSFDLKFEEGEEYVALLGDTFYIQYFAKLYYFMVSDYNTLNFDDWRLFDLESSSQHRKLTART